MSAKNIIDFPITNSVLITVFSGNNNFSLTKDGTVCVGKFVETNFSNKGKYFKNHELLGYIGKNNFESKAKKFLHSIKYQYDCTATDAILNFLNSQNYPITENENIWIIVPKNYKNPTGDKFTITFENLPFEDFRDHHSQNLDLTVYMTKINQNTKKVFFRVDIPSFIYDKCMENPDIENRLSLKYIESESLSDLHEKMMKVSVMASNVHKLLTSSKKHKKMLCIVFKTSEESLRDNHSFSYLGQKININFNYFLVYEFEVESLFSKRKSYFTWKKNMGKGTTIGEFRNYKGVVDFEKQGIKSYLDSKPEGVLIDWSQEREDFLISLENKFKALSSNLNNFLSDLNNEKIDELINSSLVYKLLNS